MPRTTLRRWQRWYDTREGEPWERMLDGRLPPKALESPAPWQALVRSLGRQDPQPSFSALRGTLVDVFGPEAGLCDNTIKRILSEAGLWSPYAKKGLAVQQVIELSGGGSLVPLLAASIETGAPAQMAKVVSELAKAQQSPPIPPPPEPEGRDENGRLTAEYNRNRLERLESTMSTSPTIPGGPTVTPRAARSAGQAGCSHAWLARCSAAAPASRSSPTWSPARRRSRTTCSRCSSWPMSCGARARSDASRWCPHQEDLFRRGRNGVGLERSHGYGVSKVRNVAVIDKREKAGRKLCGVSLEAENADQAEARATRQLEAAEQRLEQRRKEGAEELDGRHQLGVRLAQARLKESTRAAKQAKREQKKAAKEFESLQSMPEEIYVRDTGLDSIATSLKMMMLAMLEFVCQEYLGRRGITPRTFIEAWLPLPVTIRQSRWQVVYEVAPNPRDPERTALLEDALARITERKLSLGKRRLVARLRDGPD